MRLLYTRIILCCNLQFDILFLKLLDLLVQVIKLCLILLNFLFVLRNPLLVLGRKFTLLLLQFLDLALPLVVSLVFEELNLVLELLNHFFLLLQLPVMHASRREVAALTSADSRYQILRIIAARCDCVRSCQVVATFHHSWSIVCVRCHTASELRQATDLIFGHLALLDWTDSAHVVLDVTCVESHTIITAIRLVISSAEGLDCRGVHSVDVGCHGLSNRSGYALGNRLVHSFG